MMNIFKVTIEVVIILDDGLDPLSAPIEDGHRLSTTAVKYIVAEEAPKDTLNIVTDRRTNRKRKRRRNHQRIDSDGRVLHSYVSNEYIKTAASLGVGTVCNRGKRNVWLNDDEKEMVSTLVRETREMRDD